MYCLQWWRALLASPFHNGAEAHEQRKRFLAFPDGYWDQDESGGVGYLIMGLDGHTHSGGMVPPHLKAELLREGKKQRNTQAELLAILTLLLTETVVLREQ